MTGLRHTIPYYKKGSELMIIDSILGLTFTSASLMFLSITVKNSIDIMSKIKFHISKQQYEEDNPAIEEESEMESIISPRWNVEEFRQRMKNITIDEDGLFDYPPEKSTEEEAGTEIITDSFENEIERKFA